MRQQPINVGDQFKTPAGNVWKVIETLPGGRLELFNEARSLFQSRYHRDVIQWERVQPVQLTAGRSANNHKV